MKDYCLKCTDPGRENCTKLCERVLWYADQDQVSGFSMTEFREHEWQLDKDAMESSLTWAEMIDDSVLGIEEWHLISGAGLTDQQTQCIWLYFWDDRTLEEIAERLGLNHKTVHEHIAYGKRKIRAHLTTKQFIEKLDKLELSERDYEIAISYFLEHTPQTEIASKLELNQSTVSRIIEKKPM